MRKPNDVFVKIQTTSIRLGTLDSTVYERIKRIYTILPQITNVDSQIQYIDLSWDKVNYLKMKKPIKNKMNFQERYEKIKVLAKPELEIIEKNLIEDVHTREPLNSALKNFLTAPSKRIRPLLSILYLKANEENLSDKQLEILTVIELIHNASLIHDDIIDNSEIRRGIKTLCKEFDNKLAVISGDYILAIAMENLPK